MAIWWLIKWLWKWFFLPFLAGGILAGIIRLAIIAPFVGALLHIAASVFAIIKIALPMLENQSVAWFALLVVVILLSFVDCVTDIAYAIKYRFPKDSSEDKVLDAKGNACGASAMIALMVFYYMANDGSRLLSIVSHYDTIILLSFAPRAVFAIGEIFARTVLHPKALIKINSGEFFHTVDNAAQSFIPAYYEKYVNMYCRVGVAVSNKAVIAKEKELSSAKLEKMYPKKFIEQVAEKFTVDKQTIQDREDSKKELDSIEKRTAYISKAGFETFFAKMEAVLRQSGSMSPRTFLEKKFPNESGQWLPLGVEYFLIQAFTEGVYSGRIIDENKRDHPMVNHAYLHLQSEIQPKVTNANDNPLLALDDDED
jgi:signal transduction histidine kinase